jgi:transcriptional regulator with XRE-family HTH domain
MWHGDHMATRAKHYPEVDRSELATKTGFDRGYLTNILNGKRTAPIGVALAIFEHTGIQLGPLKGKSRRDISTIERAHEMTSAA